MVDLETDDEWERILAEGHVVVYKHSPARWLSLSAQRQVEQFAADHPDIPVYVLDVLTDAPISQEVERRFCIRHESPQVIVFRQGDPVWNASHRGVTAEGLAVAVVDEGPGA